jgi:hypothetical protein
MSVRIVPDKDGHYGGPLCKEIDVLEIGELWEILDDAIEAQCKAEDAKRRRAAARKKGLLRLVTLPRRPIDKRSQAKVALVRLLRKQTSALRRFDPIRKNVAAEDLETRCGYQPHQGLWCELSTRQQPGPRVPHHG